VWQTPSVDPKLGLMYFSTGNASPDLDGSKQIRDITAYVTQKVTKK